MSGGLKILDESALVALGFERYTPKTGGLIAEIVEQMGGLPKPMYVMGGGVVETIMLVDTNGQVWRSPKILDLREYDCINGLEKATARLAEITGPPLR